MIETQKHTEWKGRSTHVNGNTMHGAARRRTFSETRSKKKIELTGRRREARARRRACCAAVSVWVSPTHQIPPHPSTPRRSVPLSNSRASIAPRRPARDGDGAKGETRSRRDCDVRVIDRTGRPVDGDCRLPTAAGVPFPRQLRGPSSEPVFHMANEHTEVGWTTSPRSLRLRRRRPTPPPDQREGGRRTNSAQATGFWTRASFKQNCRCFPSQAVPCHLRLQRRN